MDLLKFIRDLFGKNQVPQRGPTTVEMTPVLEKPKRLDPDRVYSSFASKWPRMVNIHVSHRDQTSMNWLYTQMRGYLEENDVRGKKHTVDLKAFFRQPLIAEGLSDMGAMGGRFLSEFEFVISGLYADKYPGYFETLGAVLSSLEKAYRATHSVVPERTQ